MVELTAEEVWERVSPACSHHVNIIGMKYLCQQLSANHNCLVEWREAKINFKTCRRVKCNMKDCPLLKRWLAASREARE